MTARVICGDGPFRITGMELLTIVRVGFVPVILVVNNGGYGTERFLHSGKKNYNDVRGWSCHKLPEILRGGRG